MNNALDPAAMSDHARLAEVAEILALGVLRLRLRSRVAAGENRDFREHSLAERGEQSVHGAKPRPDGESPWTRAS